MGHWRVTGGAGFIGHHLVQALLARGDGVVVLDNLSAGRAERLPPGARLVAGDVLDADLVAGCLQGARGVFHLAAAVSVEACVRDLLAANRVNLGGTLTVLEAARRAGNLPVVFPSSAAVYGDDRPCSEDMVPTPSRLWRRQARLRTPRPARSTASTGCPRRRCGCSTSTGPDRTRARLTPG